MAITGTKGTRAVSKRYPVTSGITAETTKTEGRKINLHPTDGTIFRKRFRRGL